MIWLVVCTGGDIKAFNNEKSAKDCEKDRNGVLIGPVILRERYRSCFRKAA
jgi:hypothetical protein